MNFEFSEQQEAIREAIGKICAQFGDDYWLARDQDGHFPDEFVKAITAGGWLGIAMPGLRRCRTWHYRDGDHGTYDCPVRRRHERCVIGALEPFGPNPVVVFGTDEQKARMLPPLIQGLDRACFGVTEPDAGLNTTRLATRAVRDGDHYRVSGRKLWTTTAQTANKILLIARTTPLRNAPSQQKG